VTPPTEILVQVARLLEQLGIPYHVGGSIASSAHGMFRATADIDVVIDPTAQQLTSLAEALEPDFDVSRSAMDEARASAGTFNAIHIETSFKVDFFIKGPTPFDAEELRRSIRQPIGDAAGSAIMLKSPEDTVLRKLEWFRRGGEVSERQWQDVVSILRAAQGGLDDVHMDLWAARLAITDLLERARGEAEAP